MSQALPPTAAPVAKPVPTPTSDSREFFEGAKAGRLMVQRCSDCGRHRFVARRRCGECGSARSAWVECSGRAKLVSFVRVHQKFHPAFAAETPYALGTVELEEGPRLMAGLVGTEEAARQGKPLKAGMAVKVEFAPAGTEWKIPKFRPA